MALYLKDFVVVRTMQTVSELSVHFNLSAWSSEVSESLLPETSAEEVWLVVEYVGEHGRAMSASDPSITFIGTADAFQLYIQKRLDDFRLGEIRHAESIIETEFYQYILRKCGQHITVQTAIDELHLQGALLVMNAAGDSDITDSLDQAYRKAKKVLTQGDLMSVSFEGQQALMFDVNTKSLRWLLGMTMAITGARGINDGRVAIPEWCAQHIVDNNRSMFANGYRAGYQQQPVESNESDPLF